MIFGKPPSKEDNSGKNNISIQSALIRRHDIRTRSTEDGIITAIYGNGGMDGYDVTIPGRDIPYQQIRPTDRETDFVVGDEVRVLIIWFADPMTPPLAVLLGKNLGQLPGPRTGGGGPGGNSTGPTTPTPGSGGGGGGGGHHSTGITIILPAGIWFQSGGYFWGGDCSNQTQLPFNLASVTVPCTELYTANPHTTGTAVTDTGLGSARFDLSLVPTGYSCTLDPTSPLIVNSNPITGSSLFFGQPLILEPYGSGGMPASFADILTAQTKYSFVSPGSDQLALGNVAALSAMSPRGTMLFPDTAAGAHQILATMLPAYSGALGTESIITPMTETVTTGIGQYSVDASQIPLGTSIAQLAPNPDGYATVFSALDALYAEYVPFNEPGSPTVYALAATSTGDGYPPVPVTYAYPNGTPTAQGESLVAGQPNTVTQYFLLDGVSTYYLLAAAQAGGTITSITSVIDMTTSTPLGYSQTDALSITLGSPGTQGDILQVICVATLGLTQFPTSYPVANFTGFPTDAGTPDSLATFSGNIITLSAAATTGDTVAWSYDTQPATSTTETFTPGSGELSSYALAQTPIPNSVVIPPGALNTGGQGWEYLIDGNVVRAAILLPDSTPVTLTYIYAAGGGTFYSASTLNITEFDLISNTQRSMVVPLSGLISLTPAKQFTGLLSLGDALYWTNGWALQQQGFIEYDNAYDCYTVATLDGLYWRKRSTGTVSGVDFTRMPWPAGVASNDATFSANVPATGNPLSPSLKRRDARYMSLSVLPGGYAAQLAWGAVGPATSTSPSESDDPVPFYQRSASTNTWGLVASVSPRNWVTDNAGTHTLYLPPLGITHQDGEGGYALGRLQQYSGLTNSWAPAATNASAFFAPVAWCEIEDGRDVSSLNTRALWSTMPWGLTDSGLTIPAIDPTGLLLDTETIKCDLTHTEQAFVSPNAGVVAYLASEAAALAALKAAPTFTIIPWFTPRVDYGYLIGFGGYVLIRYFTLTATAPQVANRQIPGIPAPADGPPKYALAPSGAFDGGSYGKIGQEDAQALLAALVGDGTDTFYLAVSRPYWLRMMDQLLEGHLVPGTGWIEVGNGTGAGVAPDPGAGSYAGFSWGWNEAWIYLGHGYPYYGPQEVPDPSCTTLIGTYGFGGVTGSLGNGAYFHNSIGYVDRQYYGMARDGAALMAVHGDCREYWTQQAQTFLWKLNYDKSSNVLTTAALVNISQQAKPCADNPHSAAQNCSVWARVRLTRTWPAGRMMVLIREPYNQPWSVPSNPSLFVETYDSATLTLQSTAYLNLGTPYSPGMPDNVQAMAGLDPTAYETLFVTGTYAGVDVRWQLAWGTDLLTIPTVTWNADPTLPGLLAPSATDAQGLAVASNLYAWQAPDGSTMTKGGA